MHASPLFTFRHYAKKNAENIQAACTTVVVRHDGEDTEGGGPESPLDKADGLLAETEKEGRLKSDESREAEDTVVTSRLFSRGDGVKKASRSVEFSADSHNTRTASGAMSVVRLPGHDRQKPYSSFRRFEKVSEISTCVCLYGSSALVTSLIPWRSQLWWIDSRQLSSLPRTPSKPRRIRVASPPSMLC